MFCFLCSLTFSTIFILFLTLSFFFERVNKLFSYISFWGPFFPLFLRTRQSFIVPGEFSFNVPRMQFFLDPDCLTFTLLTLPLFQSIHHPFVSFALVVVFVIWPVLRIFLLILCKRFFFFFFCFSFFFAFNWFSVVVISCFYSILLLFSFVFSKSKLVFNL